MIDLSTIFIAIGLTVFLIFGLTVFRGAPYVPSQRRYIERAFSGLYKIGPDDVLVDFGSGDGLVLRMAARAGARAIGFELNPILVVLSRVLARGNSRVTTRLADMWVTPLPDETTVVYLFSVSRDRKNITKRLQQETDRIGHAIKVMTLGSGLEGRTPEASRDAYELYTLQPTTTHV